MSQWRTVNSEQKLRHEGVVVTSLDFRLLGIPSTICHQLWFAIGRNITFSPFTKDMAPPVFADLSAKKFVQANLSLWRDPWRSAVVKCNIEQKYKAELNWLGYCAAIMY